MVRVQLLLIWCYAMWRVRFGVVVDGVVWLSSPLAVLVVSWVLAGWCLCGA